MKRLTPEQRFWSYVEKTDTCWLWTGARNDKWHGHFKVSGRTIVAHRYAYELARGPLPPNTILRHTCDNPICVNPDHLIPGSHADNVSDRVSRHRSATGERNGRARLNLPKVNRIKQLASVGVTPGELAKIYEVDPKSIQNIIEGKTWRQLQEAA